ncbi:xanthine dehydrogenase molybdenum binding subunit apoprotein [Maritimibacter alkaliphilus HTCC2654]|uniref:Xanthine dehydrogenase, B subunit n=1 Tax=Maritimibacter alkaliphilus HTCC2654 TaxID=314271 RepID=A3V9T2_9RHOB|nr:xanthine dehydrogenase molybdopterin binding subunit [Maritimibacter alkaliphilus]EAQ14673.1 xanthine dehydrogenase, B subunit [Maritimibacter alkaliphilus HTCC2654]TYP82156.1 xanthine dehydrogenase molybdenum binding subunit apoprotein [Maritimibacter alkaliphilus HTCC2654]
MSMGKPLPHDSAPMHVTGAARYIDDIPVPADCLHLAFGLSHVARGVISSMDLTAVRTAPGVVRVITAADLPGVNDISSAAHDEPLLAPGEVHYHGQPIFLVVATSHRLAREAAAKAEVVIDPKPAILTIDDAVAVRSYFEGGPLTWKRGDVDPAMAKADTIIEGKIEIGGQEHFYLEGQISLASPQDNGDMVLATSTQHPTEIQHKVAEALGTPFHAVRVETRRMGGGFGGKESQGNALAIACAVAAHLTGKPCKMRYDRDDDMIITGKRHDFRIAYKAGVDAKGKLVAVEFDQYVRCGWSQDLSLPVADRAMLHADNAYFIPNIRITSHRMKTNTCSATAFRGFGGPQGMVGIERVMDHMAHRLGMDPLEFRQANFYKKSKPQETPYGQPVKGFILPDLVRQLADTANYKTRRDAIRTWNEKSPILKKGIALTPVKFGISFTLTHLNQAGALVNVYADGSVTINHGGTEMGQGLFQKVAQVAAGEFGIDMGRVRITATDTGKVPNTSATAASSGSDLNGMAVKNAVDQIKDRIARFLAVDGVKPKDVLFADGKVTAGNTVLSFEEAAKMAHENRISLSATGFYATPDISWDRTIGKGHPFYYFAHGAAITEVVIDTLTGENKILRVDILHDVGQSLNPAVDVGQIEGGFVQGAGWLTTEELVWDDKGVLRTHAPSTYKIPACSDRPDVFNVALWNGENHVPTIYRSKAVGEPPLMLGISALMALSDAVGACGEAYPNLSAPATPERVYMAAKKVGAKR